MFAILHKGSMEGFRLNEKAECESKKRGSVEEEGGASEKERLGCTDSAEADMVELRLRRARIRRLGGSLLLRASPMHRG